MWESFHWLLPNIEPPTWTDGIIAIVIVIAGFFIQRYIMKPGIAFLGRFVRDNGSPVIADILEQFSTAIRRAFMAMLIILSLSVLVETWLFTYPSTKNFFLSLMFYYAFKGINDVLTFYLKNPERVHTGKDQDLLTPFFLRISKVLIMIIAMFSIASLWNFNINGFLTGIGLTGVAIAFGIRDTLGHLFGGMSVALDKPFQIGDWIATEDNKIDGIVEDINLRSTLIQTGDKGLVYVPNAYLVNRPIYNLSKRTKRKCEQYFYVSSTNQEDQLRALVEKIRKQITLHPQIEKDIIHVAIDDFKPGSYRLFIRYHVTTNDTGVMLMIKQDIVFLCKHLFDEFAIELVPETNELWLRQE
ncbi:mechanosensitive ion channel family protein [Lysinibacillus odysseyi]|uniref:mechanosensitive ion channel family protein n=1 Tax=Lysinibacillus odysseyi TaxID=202611 RepID=UPI000561B178|nr:mechanosensitive ion channel domain-containing protein [Lysinibacillus odysseyi]